MAVRLLFFTALFFIGRLTTLAQHHVGQQILEANVQGKHEDISAYLDVGPMDVARPRASKPMDRSKWTVKCDSEQIPFICSNAIDDNKFSFWRSAANGRPHSLTVHLNVPITVSGISMLPTRDIDTLFEGNIATHEVYLSLDGSEWGTPVAYGTWWGDNTEKFSTFEPKQAQHVKLVAKSAALGESFINVANFSVWITENASLKPLAQAPAGGRWGQTIDFPIVPAGAWVEPLSGKVVTFSSYGHDRFDDRKNKDPATLNRTLTATWDPITKLVSQRIVSETGHDMFCPGMSLDATGRMIVTGGRTNTRTSIYNSDDSWGAFPEMHVRRGYQSSVTCSDGRIFVIGGSWESVGPGAKCGNKNGEIYDPTANDWTLLPQCPVKPMLTAQTSEFNGCDTFRSDNHGWLFPWKKGTVFQAGPSKSMNWYTLSGQGGWSSAGKRSNDDDAMCGVAVMYDASQGKILTAGGAQTYGTTVPTNKAFTITLNNTNFNSTVGASIAPSMANQRIYHHAVILPTGDTLVVGGRSIGGIFNDDQAVYEPEIYSPTNNRWTKVASNSIPRTYHSFALLLPDASVLVGGGGLCGDCKRGKPNAFINHFDAQTFTPPYLLTSSGKFASRPVIVGTSDSVFLAGDRLTIHTDSAIVNVSLIRYGSATHGLNTDQRRIPLKPISTGANKYEVGLPLDRGILIPGYWMLFVINAKGVPSLAVTVLVK